jgi:hypothetical protein
MNKIQYLPILLLLFFLTAQGQSRKEASTYFDMIKSIAETERLGTNLLYRLDTLKSQFIPSRSYIYDHFNREIDFGFKHRRINMGLNFIHYQIDILGKNDTIFLTSIKSIDYGSINYNQCEKTIIEQFLTQRNKFYSSSKSKNQLVEEISLTEVYAFYCGDGLSKTEKGKYIEQLVTDETTDTLTDMLQSFNCETQAFGVAGLQMLIKKDFQIPVQTQRLINYIIMRNSEIVICSGCISGIIEKIYTKG